MDERRALEEFCAEAYAPLVGAFSLTVQDRFLAEELAQESLLRACRRWSHVRNLESPVGWCYRVGLNLSRNAARREGMRRRVEARRLASRPHVDEDVGERLAVEAALNSLTHKQRQAVVLRYFLGLTAEEAASTLKLTAVAVRGLTHRALRTLKPLLSSHDISLEVNDGS